jgi:hypothetical protein
MILHRYNGFLVSLGLLGSCQGSPAAPPETADWPPCFEQPVPQARAGMGKARLRWIYRADDAFRPQAVEVSLDGRRVYTNENTDQLQRELVHLADVDLSPGQHRLDSLVKVSGWGEGLFAYLKDYRVKSPNQRSFSLRAGEVRCISLVVFYRDGLTLPIEQRPTTDYVDEAAP